MNRPFSHLKRIIFTFFLLSLPVLSRDTLTYQMPRIVVTANRYEKDLFESHLQANVLHEDLAWQQGRSGLGEWLDIIPGISRIQSGPWSEKQVIRGLSEAHVLTLVDGMKLDVLRHYGNHAPLVDIEQIERVEIIRGPGSVLYGSNAVAGVINIITKSPENMPGAYALKSRVGLQYATANRQFNQVLTLSGKYGKYNMLLNISHRKADDIDTPSGRLANTAFSGTTADFKFGFHPNDAHRLLLSTHLTRMDDVGIPLNPRAKSARFTAYNRDRIAFSYQWHPEKKILAHLKTEFYLQQGEREFDAFLYHIPKGALYVNNRLNAHRDVKTAGGSFQTGWHITPSNFLTAGMDLFYESDDTRRIADAEVVDIDDQIKMNPPADRTPPTPGSSRKGFALFLEDEWRLSDLISLNSGLRTDLIYSDADGTANTLTERDKQVTDGDISASLGTVIRLSGPVRWTLNIGRAFKSPTLQERFFKGTAQVGYLEGNPDLKSETSMNLDSGLRLKTERLETSLSVFRNQIDHYIIMNPVVATADTFLYENVGEAVLYGAEWDARLRWTFFTLFADVAYVRGQDREQNTDLPKMPPLHGTLGIELGNKSGDYWITLSGQLVSEQTLVAKNEMTTNGYELIHVSSGWNIGGPFHMKNPVYLTLNIQNLFNTSYRDHLSSVTWWDAPGRNIIFGIRGNF